MLKGIFDTDNPVMRVFLRLGNIWWLNILWLLTSLPIITIGASTTALIYSSMKLIKNEGYITGNFFGSFKENFRQSTVIWVIFILAGFLLSVDLYYFGYRTEQGMGPAIGISIAVLLVYLNSLLYVFAIQSRFYNTVTRTLYYSLVLPYRHLKETVLMLVTVISLVIANHYLNLAFNFMFLNLGIGLTAYLFSVFYIRIFENY
ncbi:MAG TPA: hypothetical protein DCL38_01955 [Lachnospiraceae bacterium]|nr:hypothetical protein [Lachnospiraceae bacterium]